MTYLKVSITLEAEVAAELDTVAGPRGRSAFVNAAVRQRLQAIRVRTLLDEIDRESGPVPEDVQRSVNALAW